MSLAALQSLSASAGSADVGVPANWPLAEYSRMVRSFGTHWHVQEAGSGPTLVLLHGTAASTHSFRALVPLLARDFSVIAIDLPGHGFSSRLPDRDMSLPAIARGIDGLFETLGRRPRFLVGHSAGAAIALALALRSSAPVDAVVGLNAALLPYGGPFTRLFSPLAQFFASTRLMPALLARRALNRRAVERVIRGTGSVLDPDGIELYQALFSREEHLSAVLAMMAAWELGDLNRGLPTLESRLLLVSGGRDRAVDPSEADRVAARLESAEVVCLEDCGHLAHEEAPARVAELITRFCLDKEGRAHAPD